MPQPSNPGRSRKDARSSPAETIVAFTEEQAIAALSAYAADNGGALPTGTPRLILSKNGTDPVKLQIKES